MTFTSRVMFENSLKMARSERLVSAIWNNFHMLKMWILNCSSSHTITSVNGLGNLHCNANYKLTVNWPALRQSRWSNFLSHVTTRCLDTWWLTNEYPQFQAIMHGRETRGDCSIVYISLAVTFSSSGFKLRKEVLFC